ncbi:MAG: oxygen-dependent coproporphyrinogen oxidase [Flavobacteriales bacterium]|nr:oxygen-dependent coproporphyrinogen oxidase [Flavobacteriales bacterium]
MEIAFTAPDKWTISQSFELLQDKICSGLERADGKSVFHEDKWERDGGGGGRTRVIADGNVFEKGGVNVSTVFGKIPEFLQGQTKNNAKEFFATGLSIVIHPSSPLVPIIHMNVRYFETDGGDKWFGGGLDLTPIYVDLEDVQFFHRTLKNTCDQFDPAYYPLHKQQANDYFFIKHRNETRGIGGIFFDHMRPQNQEHLAQLFDYTVQVGETFLPAYLPLVEKSKGLSFSPKQKQWQLLRRGRYVEFNLVYDKGTRFGLETNGRTESILMSLPKEANWLYNFEVDPNSPEEFTLNYLRKGIEFIPSPSIQPQA